MFTHVLVVDDVLATCHLLSHCLAIIGAKADCAESGAAAFVAMAKVRPALVFLDYMMPEMDGLEVLSRMKADASLSTIPVVMFTANDSRKFAVEAMRLGAIGVLIKGTADLKDFQRYVMGVMTSKDVEESLPIMVTGHIEESHPIKVCSELRPAV